MGSSMKTFLLLVLFFSLSLNAKTLSQEMLEGGDIFILNSSSKNVWIRIYPISMVFNVDIFGNGNYDFHSMSPLPLYFSFINGKGLNHIGNGKHLLSPENGRLS
jgi:hypothetical protein